MNPRLKETYRSWKEAYNVCLQDFTNGYPRWIYEVRDGYQITCDGFQTDRAPDYIMSFEEFSKLRDNEFLYEDVDCIENLAVVRVGVNKDGVMFQGGKAVSMTYLREYFLNMPCYLSITYDYPDMKQALNFIKEFHHFLFDKSLYIGFKPYKNNGFIFAKGTSKFNVERELRNVHVFYKVMSDKNTFIE